MRKFRGFKIRKRLVAFYRRRRSSTYRRISSPRRTFSRLLSTLCSWTRLKSKAKRLCSVRSGMIFPPRSGYVHVEKKPVHVPKGHLAVYIGEKFGGEGDGDLRRVLIPVFYFNHPLFGDLLREAEEEYGFNQEGGITIPCRIKEFEKVRNRIKQGGDGRKLMAAWR